MSFGKYKMNYTKRITMAGLLLTTLSMSANAADEQALSELNAEVEKTAQQIDHQYGVLLTTQERNKLKRTLIVHKITAQLPDKSVQSKADAAIEKYQIADPTEQRKLLIELEAIQSADASSGNEPP